MLRKTLKYDFRSSAKLWIITSAVITVMIWLSAFSIRTLQRVSWTKEDDALAALAISIIVFTVIGVSIYLGGSVFVGATRMYKSFFTDEGYLTFTLPVSRVTLFNSKLIHGISLSAASLLLVFINLIGLLSIVPSSQRGPMMIVALFDQLQVIFDGIDFWGVIFLLLVFIAVIMSFIFFQLLIYTCLVLGCVVVHKARLAMSVGAYIAISTATSFIYYAITAIMTTVIPAMDPLLSAKPDGQITAILIFVALAAIAFFTVLSALAYSFSLGRIRRGLNLS